MIAPLSLCSRVASGRPLPPFVFFCQDMIDDALLRPGRLEVHVEIGLPDEAGRLQILQIHTRGMVRDGGGGTTDREKGGERNELRDGQREGLVEAERAERGGVGIWARA